MASNWRGIETLGWRRIHGGRPPINVGTNKIFSDTRIRTIDGITSIRIELINKKMFNSSANFYTIRTIHIVYTHSNRIYRKNFYSNFIYDARAQTILRIWIKYDIWYYTRMLEIWIVIQVDFCYLESWRQYQFVIHVVSAHPKFSSYNGLICVETWDFHQKYSHLPSQCLG